MSLSAETVATNYIQDRVIKARSDLKRTQILSIAVMIFVCGYFGTVGYLMKTRILNPEPAAEVATGQILGMIGQYGPESTAWLKENVPPMVARLPDMVISQLPAGREQLEEFIAQQLQDQSVKASATLATHIDEYLVHNKDNLDAFIEAAQHPEGVAELGDALEKELRAWLDHRFDNGETVRDVLARTQVSLTKLETTLDRLARAKDLTEQEKKLRLAIAIIMQTTKEATAPSS
jgi:hypothetical protein